MKEFARLYNIYNSLIFQILRVPVYILFILIIISDVPVSIFKLSLSIISILLILEVFFFFKIERLKPAKYIQNNDGKSVYDSFTISALSVSTTSGDLRQLIENLLFKKEIDFILSKSGIKKEEIQLVDISHDQLANQAFQVAKNAKGFAVTNMDIFAAYILLSENKTKLLYNKDLKQDEFIHILIWARKTFKYLEHPPPVRLNFWGEGIGEQWVFGWTIETKKYMLDIISKIAKGATKLVGREKEYERSLEALYQNKSLILIGEQGSGKTTIVEAIASDSFDGKLKDNLSHQRFFQLLTDRLLAGTGNQGELEKRLNEVIEEVAHSGSVIIFISDIENIFGASTFNLNLAGVLTPYMERGVIRIIGTTTPSAFKKYIEPMKSLGSVFSFVQVNPPDKETAIQMLLEKASEIEKEKRIGLTYKSIIAAFDYSGKYLQGSSLPGAGVSLLEDTVASAIYAKKQLVNEKDIIKQVETKTKIAIGAPQKKEKELLLKLEDEFHKYVIDQEQAVSAISEGLRRIRTGLESKDKPISFLFLGPTGVGKTETAKTLAKLYFGDESKMIRVDMSEYSTNESVKRLLGGLPDEQGLTDKVYAQPFSLILLDEFEKSSPVIRDLFLQVLDDGRLTDNKGQTVSFVDTIIIATSNAASEYIREEIKKERTVDKKFQMDLLDFLQQKNLFKPELLNRFDEVVVFRPLGKNESIEITKIILKDLSKKLADSYITATFDEKVIDKIINEGVNEEFGARPLRRYIQNNIEDIIAQKILKEEIKKGDKVLFSTDENNKIMVNQSQ